MAGERLKAHFSAKCKVLNVAHDIVPVLKVPHYIMILQPPTSVCLAVKLALL